ncbi:MAG TPA: chemotaxis protein CheW [Longimicrobiales bacterium]
MDDSLTAQRAPARAHIDVLRRRAASLARVPHVQRSLSTVPALVFGLGKEFYAVDARIVLQVHVLRDMTPLPGARAALFGITHWRGAVLTILDLRDALGVRTRGLTDLSRVVVIDGGRQPWGILADSARDFVELEERAIRPLSREEAAGRTLVRGITDDGVLVLDTEAVLSTGRAAAPDDDHGGRGG